MWAPIRNIIYSARRVLTLKLYMGTVYVFIDITILKIYYGGSQSYLISYTRWKYIFLLRFFECGWDYLMGILVRSWLFYKNNLFSLLFIQGTTRTTDTQTDSYTRMFQGCYNNSSDKKVTLVTFLCWKISYEKTKGNSIYLITREFLRLQLRKRCVCEL